MKTSQLNSWFLTSNTELYNYSSAQPVTEFLARIVQMLALVLNSGYISKLQNIIYKVYLMELIFDLPDELSWQWAH